MPPTWCLESYQQLKVFLRRSIITLADVFRVDSILVATQVILTGVIRWRREAEFRPAAPVLLPHGSG